MMRLPNKGIMIRQFIGKSQHKREIIRSMSWGSNVVINHKTKLHQCHSVTTTNECKHLMNKHIRVVKSIKIDHDKITNTSTKTSIRSLVKTNMLKPQGSFGGIIRPLNGVAQPLPPTNYFGSCTNFIISISPSKKSVEASQKIRQMSNKIN